MASDPRAALCAAFEQVLSHFPEDGDGIVDTPCRAADALLEMLSGYQTDIPALCKTFDAEGYDEMVVVTGIPFTSLCMHHVLPFTGKAHVAYVPDKRVIGLSKIPRIVQAFARRLQIQERLTAQVADALEEHLQPLGVMVVAEAEHACAAYRGVRAVGTRMSTSAVRGVLRDKAEARAEALALFGRAA